MEKPERVAVGDFMLQISDECKPATAVLFTITAAFTFLCVTPALAQPTHLPSRCGASEQAELRAAQTRTREEKSTSRNAIAVAFSNLERQREEDDDDKKAMQRMQAELGRVQTRYRNILGAWARTHTVDLTSCQPGSSWILSEYERSMEAILGELALAQTDLVKELAQAGWNDEAAAAARGKAKGRLIAAYLEAGVVAETWAAWIPVTEADVLLPMVKGTGLVPDGRFSTLLGHMAWLAWQIGAVDPANPIIPAGQDGDIVRFMAKANQDAAHEEYQRLARTGLLLNPVNLRPVTGQRRIDLARVLETNLQEYLSWKGSQQGEYARFWLRSDDRLRLAAELKKEIETSPEYRIGGFLDAGVEPDFKQFFLAAALAVSHTQMDLQQQFSSEYLGEGFWNTGLGQLLRANDAFGTGEAGVTAVKARVEQAISDGDVLIRAFRKAANTDDPAMLKANNPQYYRLLHSFGYVVEFTGRDNKPAYSYRIPGTTRSLGNQLRLDRASANIPGASMLDVITPKSVGITVLSMVVPELTAAWLTSGATAFTTTSGGLLAIRAVAEMGAGFYMDAAIEKCEQGNKARKTPGGAGASYGAFLVNCTHGKVNYEKLVLESVVLGSLLQVTGAKSSEAIEWLNWRHQRALRTDILHKELGSRIRPDPGQYGSVWSWAGDVLGLAQETAITEAFQMASEGRDFDLNLMMGTLINNTLSRTMASGKQTLEQVMSRPDVPRVVRDILSDVPAVREEVRQNHLDRMNRLKQVRERYQALTRETDKPGRLVFEALLNGDLTWTQMKNLYAADPDAIGDVMTEVAERREQFFVQIIDQARKRSIEDIELYFAQRIEQAVRDAGGREQAREAIASLEKRRQAELDLVNDEIKTPGSKNPTSDIDRSSSSAFLRKNLVHLYEAHARWRVDGDLPTSARAFDVNEYINVFPFITENAGLVREIKQQQTVDGYPHPDYMEAMSLSGAIQHMNPTQAERYLQGQRDVIAMGIAEGRATDADLTRFNEMASLAQDSLANSRKRLAEYAEDIARQEGRDPADPEMQLKAREYMYDLRMREIRDLQWALSEQERKLGDPRHPDAIRQRALIERKMSLAMRDGIETYSYTVGLDIIVNRVQSATKQVTNEKGETIEVPMSVADRLEDPAFVLGDGGELDGYTVQDMRAVLNDQVMFIAEHINGFNSGHESTYLAGRGIGKYTERAFLALKIMGLDITEVRGRSANDPTRRLLEVSQALAGFKNDPLAMNDYLATLSRVEPGTPAQGLAEVLYLIEQVIPGLQGASGVVPDPQVRIEIPQPEGPNPWARPGRVTALAREQQRLDMLATGGGDQFAYHYLQAELEQVEKEIAFLESTVNTLHQQAGKHRMLDWNKIEKYRNTIANLRVQKAALLYRSPNSTIGKTIDTLLKQAEANLETALQTPVKGDVQSILYRDPSNWTYRYQWNRLQWLQVRKNWIIAKLADYKKLAEIEALYANQDLGGEWTCRSQDQAFSMQAQQQGKQFRASLDGRSQGTLDTDISMIARLDFDAISGFWIDPSKPKETLDLPVSPGDTRMMFQGTTSPEGDEIRFTYAPRHPRVGFSLQDVICTRGVAGTATASDFLKLEFPPIPANEPGWKPETNHGFVRARLHAPGRGVENHPFTLVKGQRRVKSSLGVHIGVAAGDYIAVIRLGGRQTRVPIEVRAGGLSEIRINAAVLQVQSLDSKGQPLATTWQLYPLDDPSRKRSYISQDTGQAALLTPGRYRVHVGDAAGLGTNTEIEVGPGGQLETIVRWKAIIVPSVTERGGRRVVMMQRQVGAELGNDWIAVTDPFIQPAGDGYRVQVPEGTYAASLVDGQIIRDLEAR